MRVDIGTRLRGCDGGAGETDKADVTEKKISYGCLQPDIVSANFWGHLQQNPFTKNNTKQTYLLADKDLDFIQQTLSS